MNQAQAEEEDTMVVEQIPMQANQTRFAPIPREGLVHRETGLTWWE